jgi:ribonuclease BN (tRNA processing enzyme)
MRLTVLGSGTVAPTADRAAPGYWLEAGAVRLLLECGAGTLLRAAAAGVPWAGATHVAISHFHLDHWGELPHYLFALRWGTVPPRATPITLLGPTGLRARLTLAAGAYEDWLVDPPYGLDVLEVEPDTAYQLADGVALECHKTPHTEHSLAYAVTCAGTRVVYTGDTGYSDALADWAGPCDLLLAECSLPEEHAVDTHLTPERAGRLAARAGAKHLVLTHFYPLYGDRDPAALARSVFDGTVTAARDGNRFEVGAV